MIFRILATNKTKLWKENELKHFNLSAMIATSFGIGRMPVMPGTWGSLATLPLAWGISYYFGSIYIIIISIILFFIGILVSNLYLREFGGEDPGPIVIDEVVGQLLTIAFVPLDLFYYVTGFALFRVFDIFKPWPVSWVDKEIKGGLGIMLDDVVASLYSGSILYFCFYLLET